MRKNMLRKIVMGTLVALLGIGGAESAHAMLGSPTSGGTPTTANTMLESSDNGGSDHGVGGPTTANSMLESPNSGGGTYGGSGLPGQCLC